MQSLSAQFIATLGNEEDLHLGLPFNRANSMQSDNISRLWALAGVDSVPPSKDRLVLPD